MFYAQGRRRVHLADAGVDRVQLRDGDRGRGGPAARPPNTPGRDGWLAVAVARQPRRARRLQVRELLRRQRQRAARRSWRRRRSPSPQVLLPIGISFFTFQAISYVVDVYRGDAARAEEPAPRGALHAALPAAHRRADRPLPRHRRPARAPRRSASTTSPTGVRRFIIGLGKKMLIANIVAAARRRDLRAAVAAQLTPALAWLGDRLLHAADLLRLLGLLRHGDRPRAHVRLPVPRELQLPVHRRHASRSSGAAGTSRCRPGSATTSTSRSAATACTPRHGCTSTSSLVFFLCGLWHGASWNFVVWGLFHGIVPRRRAARPGGARQGRALPRAVRHAYLLARRDGRLGVLPRGHAAAARRVSRRDGRALAAPGLQPFDVAWFLTPEVSLALAAGVVGSTPIVPALVHAADRHALSDVEGPGWLVGAAATAALMAVLFASILQIAGRTYNPFIYFRF